MDQFVVYVLFSEGFDKLYVGYTHDLIARFHSHNSAAKKGFTLKYRPWHVVHIEFFESKQQALIREKQLKSARGRLFIKNEIIPKLMR